MKSKLLKIVLVSALFLLPATVWAQISTNVSASVFEQNNESETQEKQIVPLRIYNGTNLYSEGKSLTTIRNQISETALVEEEGSGYKVTLRIGSYQLLDMLQIVKEEKVDEVLDVNNAVTGGKLSKLPAGTFTPWKGGEEAYQAWVDGKKVDASYNDYYYTEDEMVINRSADSDMDAGTVTIHVSDLSKPILVKTYSSLYGKAANPSKELPVNQIVSLMPESAMEYKTLKEGNYSKRLKWMGYKLNETITSISHTRVSQAGADNFFSTGITDAVSVKVDANGAVFATLQIKQLEDGNDNQIVKIERAVRRNTSDNEGYTASNVKKLLSEYHAEYEELEIKDGQVVVPVRDLIYGQGLRVSTKKMQEANQTKLPEKYQYNYVFLHIWTGEAEEKVTYSHADTGISIVYYKSDFPDGTPEIGVTAEADYLTESTFNSYVNFSKDYRVYTIKVSDSSGKKVNTVNPVKKVIPIPEGWDIETLQILRRGEDNVSAELSPGNYLNKEKNALVFSDNTIGNNNCTLFIYDAGKAESAEGLEDGLYKTKVGIGHKDNSLRVSLSNVAFAEKDAYIEVKDGLATLYTDVGSASFGTQSGYLSNMFYLDGENNEAKNEVSYLKYGTDDAGNVRVNTDQKQYMAFEVERVAFPLKNPTKSNTYWVSFYIPAMDAIAGGLPGSGKSEQSAQVRLTQVEKVENGENPIHVYDQSVVLAGASYLGFLGENGGWSDDKASYAKRISQETKEQIANGSVVTEKPEGVAHALAILNAAANSLTLEKGIYEIPVTNKEDWSDYKAPVNVMIKDGNMTLQLEKADQSLMPSVEYHGDYGNYQTDASVSEDGKRVSFTVPYTEAPLAVKTGLEELVLSLDFANAKRMSADLSSLKLLLEKAKEIKSGETRYTTSTEKVLTDEIKNTEALLETFDAGQAKINDQNQSLLLAIDGLLERANLTQLKKDLVQAVKASRNTDYTEKSRKNLTSLIDEIQKQIQKEDDVSKKDADNYRNRLEEEMAALEEGDDDNGNDTETDGSLKSFLKDYESWVKEENFTKESWDEFAVSMSEAEDLLLKGDLTKTEEEEAIQKLLEARNKLIADTGTENRLASLAETLKEIKDRSSEYAGLLTYGQLEASMEAAELAIEGNCYLTNQEITLLEKSLKAHDKVCEAEANGPNETQSLQMEIPELQLEDLKGLEEKKTVKLPEKTVSETEPLTESEPGTETGADETEEEAEARGEAEAKANSETKADAESKAKAETKTDAESKAKAETKTEAESKAKAETKTEAESKAKAETKTEAETKAKVETETNSETKADAETKTKAETNAKAENKAKAETKAETEAKFKTETKSAAQSFAQAKESVKTASISRNNTYILTAADSTDTKKDGTYSVDYDLWKWNENKASMGNPAMDYGTEPGKIIRDNGKWTLYIHFNKMKYDGFEGSLRTMKKMIDLKENEDGISYKTQKADYPKTVSDFPDLLGFVVTPESGKQFTYLPVEVEVDVPGMALGAQNARLRVDWDSLDYINGSTDIDSSLDLEELQKAIEKAEKLESKKSAYTPFSWKVLTESIKTAKEIKASSLATQEMADSQVKAMEASIDALVKVADDSTLSNLSSVLMEAYLAEESDYSINAWKELERARTFAEGIQEADHVTEGMVKQAVLSLTAAIDRTGGGSGKDEEGLSTSVLERLIRLAEKETEGNYTRESWKDLESALKEAKSVLIKAARNQCTQGDIDEQTLLLKEAYNSLKKEQKPDTETGTVNYKYLKALITRSKEFLALSSKYTDESIRRLLLEYDTAVLMLEDDSVVQEDVDEQKENLRTAINGLEVASNPSSSTGSGDDKGSKSSSKSSSKSGRKDGYYKVKVRLWHASMDKASLGESAILPTAYVMIEDGDVTMRLQTKKMSLQGITAHLHDFYIYNDGDYETTDLISTEDNKWIFEFELPDDDSKYYKCQVDPQVEVMGSDPVKARLKVDWSSISKSTEDAWDDLSGDVDEDKDDTSKTGTAASVSELISSETGIRIRGNTGGPAVTVEVSKKTSGTEYEKAQAALSETVNHFVLYDIKLKSGSSYIQPKESVTLRIPVPTGYDTEKLILYRINDEGEKEEISGKMNGSYYEASVDHFSLYALAESDYVLAASSSKVSAMSEDKKAGDGTKTGSGSSKGLKSSLKKGTTRNEKAGEDRNGSASLQTAAGRVIPYTGDRTPVKELMGAGVFAVLIALLSGVGRKKEENQSER